ncbi:PLP-dependent aminotransferase family protein [Hoeflea ulvae]|uniref:PLP-dependent aminotransferase family protein n=1 Tax=Hoeflea ulvae TaxID=2983764 RepID=A0ABT3YC48_9HYPH|nr:PLP-dependent aminotransferase family protein [Hoeflea ulvae]MCY0093457.1 PLP-dependent aminotransferase family protein [Hoeflea ulvae]
MQYSQIARRTRPSGIRAAQTERPDMISFSKGHPDPSLFQVPRLQGILDALLSGNGAAEASLQYSTGAGIEPLRREICRIMQERGVGCGPENILITNGSQQGLFMSAMAFADPGQHVMARQPVYTGALQVFQTLGLSVVEPDAADASPALLYEIPNFHNPTGACLDLAARTALVDQVHRAGAILIEDDPYGLLRYEGEDLPGLLAIDAGRDSIETARTLYLGSLSKTVAPGLRIGWVVGPAAIISHLTDLKYVQDIQSGTLVQQLAAGFLKDDFNGATEAARSVYRDRRDALLAALDTRFGARGGWIRPEGGFFIWVELDGGIDAAALLRRAMEKGVNFVPGSAFGTGGRFASHIRLGFSHSDPADFDRGIARLAEAHDDLIVG